MVSANHQAAHRQGSVEAPRPDLARMLAALENSPGVPAVLATLVAVAGSSYRRPGARLLVFPDGRRVGLVSGGCLEEDIMEHARRVLASGRAERVIYDTTTENDLVWGVGLGCQGVVQILLEPIPAERPVWLEALRANQRGHRDTHLLVDYAGDHPRGTQLGEGTVIQGMFCETVSPPPGLLICGAGDDAQPLAQMAKLLGWHVTVADTRGAYATSERFPGVDRLLSGPVANILQQASIGVRSFVVVMTHRYGDDRAFLRELLPLKTGYIGQLGPRKRTERLLAELQAEGLDTGDSAATKLHAPVGLDLGGSTAESIALAILAEMQARLSGSAGGFLKNRPGPIHGG